MKRKVAFFDNNLVKNFWAHLSGLLTIFSGVVLFIDDTPLKERWIFPVVLILFLIVWYVFLWWRASNLKNIDLDIESTTISIVTGDLFKQDGLKAIPFNEYFDTQVDDEVISKASLNGIFITDILLGEIEQLDSHILSYKFREENILEKNTTRIAGKNQKYQIGTVCLYKDYLLTAFSKFNDKNQAYLQCLSIWNF